MVSLNFIFVSDINIYKKNNLNQIESEHYTLLEYKDVGLWVSNFSKRLHDVAIA